MILLLVGGRVRICRLCKGMCEEGESISGLECCWYE